MLIKGKDTLFWTILFPIALFTFMYMAFGNIMEKDEMFKDIPGCGCEGWRERYSTYDGAVFALHGRRR